MIHEEDLPHVPDICSALEALIHAERGSSIKTHDLYYDVQRWLNANGKNGVRFGTYSRTLKSLDIRVENRTAYGVAYRPGQSDRELNARIREALRR
ncbi:hypothetical protein ACTMTU_09060 [Streptomyces sp. OZ13]|uniref:hypothetical protein n=1 Tax=Streptomyces sp. OZ13 TaxID=3452210 RepID=UPI003F89160F